MVAEHPVFDNSQEVGGTPQPPNTSHQSAASHPSGPLSVSPSSAARTPSTNYIDLLAFPSTLTKERLKEIALHRLAEVRAEVAQLNQEKQSLLMQLEEVRELNALLRERRQADQEQLDRSSVTVHEQQSPPAAVSQPSSSVKLAQPEKFNGSDKTPTISNWLITMRRYLRVAKIEVSDQIDVAATFLTGTAMDWWNGVEKAEGSSIYRMGWEEFEDRCTRRFQAANDSHLAYQRLVRWRQTGSLAAYVSGFQSFVQQIPKELVSEQGRILLFTEGLKGDPQKAVKLLQPTTLEEAISTAQRGNVNAYPSQSNPPAHSQPNRQPSTLSRSSTQVHRSTSANRHQALAMDNVEEMSPPLAGYPESDGGNGDGEDDVSELDCSYMNAEQKKLFKEKRCFKCKQVGHHRHRCKATTSQTKESARV
jgi:Ty3 transposon capsid-like protein